MILNHNVNVDTERNQYADHFYPDEGYALWRDNEEGNLDENGQPYQYVLQINIPKNQSEAAAPHIWAKLIDETMESFVEVDTTEVSAYGLGETSKLVKLFGYSHTYIDENGIEQPKKGVY